MPFRLFGRRCTSPSDERIDQIHQDVLKLAGLYEARQKHSSSSIQERTNETLEELRKALPKQEEDRIPALEAKVSILTNLYQVWATHNTDRVAIADLGREIDKLKPDPDEVEKKRDGANLAIFTTLALFIGSVVSVIVYITLLHKPGPDTWELISYLAPALAAVCAGLTAYVKKLETLFVWASSILVLSGVGAFFFYKSIEPLMLWNWLIGYAFTVTVFWWPYFYILRRRKPDTRMKKGLVFASLFFLLLGIWFDVEQSHGYPPKSFTTFVKRVSCYFSGSAADDSVGRSPQQGDKKGDDDRNSCTHT
jgi:hypothetical protein